MIAPDLLHILETHGRHELGRLPGLGHLGVELVDLLEREALGLVDEGVDEADADEAEGAPVERCQEEVSS